MVYEVITWCFETGTQSLEGIAGITATIEYFNRVANSAAAKYIGNWPQFSGRRRNNFV